MSPNGIYILIPGTHECHFMWNCRCNSASWDGEITMGYLSGPRCNYKYLCKKGGWGRFDAEQGHVTLKQDVMLYRWRKGPRAEECKECSSRSWKRLGDDSPLEPSEGVWTCWQIDFAPVKMISDLWPPRPRQYVCVV